MNAIIRFPKRTLLQLFIVGVLAVGASQLWADELKDGRAALQAGRYDDALRLFEKAAGQGSAEGRAGVGQVWLRRRQYAKAMEAFQLAQKMDPNLALAHYGEGEVLRRQDQCDGALPLLQRAVALDRKFPDAQLALGDCLIRTKQHEKAVAVLSQGLKWGSKWAPRFMVALGDAELARDSLRDAGIWYTKARQESPDDPTPRRALGDFYVKRGTFELAVPEYQAAIEKDTSDVELHFRLGQALFYAQRYNDALEKFRWVVQHDPEFAPGLLALGDLLYRSGAADPRRYVEARSPLEKYVQMMPQDPRGWSVLGRTYYHLNLKEEALQAMNKAEQLGDKSKEMFTRRARIYTERGDFDKARADYARGEVVGEDLLRMAQVLVLQKNTVQAESLYRAIVEQDSTSRSARFALNELGKLRFRDKDYPGAIEIFQRRIALDPNSDEAYYYIGLSYKEMKRYPEALTALREAARLGDSKPDRHFWLGIMLAQVDSSAAARRELTRAVELDSAGTNKNSGVALRQLGFYKLLDRDYPDAIRMLERAVQINQQDTQAWVWLAQGYQNSGNRGKACEAYRRTLGLDPNQADALRGKKSLGC
jgi:tetratricopeptide (TPR) repeat protein